MKSLKRKDSDCRDHLSHLPESIITRILSLLPTKDVLRTSLLARSWEFRWTSIYNVNIVDNAYYSDGHSDSERDSDDEDEDGTNKGEKFVKFVERIVLHCRNVNSFRLWCHFEYDNASNVTAWMSALFTRNIENFELTMPRSKTEVVIARSLLDCTSLRKLLLHLPCTFRAPVKIFLPNLTALDLVGVHFMNQNSRTDTLLFTFPALESFKQEGCKWSNVKFVEICAPKLTYFESKRYGPRLNCDGYSIKILGARIKRFATHGTYLENFVLIGTTVLSATLDHHYFGSGEILRQLGLQVRKLLREFSGLKHLRLSGLAVIKAISLSKQGLPLPRFNQLKQLEVFSRFDAEGVLELLHATPVLGSLLLNVASAGDYEYSMIQSVPFCIASHLEELKLDSFGCMKSQYHVARFFMRNGAMLKRIYVCVNDDADTEIAPIIEKLSRFPKASACLKIGHLESINPNEEWSSS